MLTMKASVLVIDDHPVYQQRLRSAAQARGFQVLPSVVRVDEAIEAVAEAAPDILILDLHLRGDVDGLDLCRLLGDILSQARIVVTSGFEDPDLMERAFAAGAARCLRKPFRMDEALRLFENLAREREEVAG